MQASLHKLLSKECCGMKKIYGDIRLRDKNFWICVNSGSISRLAFICKFSEAATTAFCELHSQRLIFNDLRMVNWCPTLQSAISDQEVDIVDVGKMGSFEISTAESKKKCIEVGIMHRIRYELVNTGSMSEMDYLEVATTRPETVFADCALAVHPDDERYVKYIGRLVRHPLLPDRTLPVLAATDVKAGKGTGWAIKISVCNDSSRS
ncbi:unnamed protein product [Gongylonema pulchrum]|uniref:valine--tRNA ligase n=1 Tax=Gongylonema pulchrum TaxID=637853 RepID=A0A183CV66_9BILA|nr:unnamed protein product [Gongylonema pulchrum]